VKKIQYPVFMRGELREWLQKGRSRMTDQLSWSTSMMASAVILVIIFLGIFFNLFDKPIHVHLDHA